MAGLLQLRDALALCGRADATRLSVQLNLSAAITRAMLEQLVGMGQVERIEPHNGGGKGAGNTGKCGACRHCPQNGQESEPIYRLIGTNRRAAAASNSEFETIKKSCPDNLL